MRAIERASAVSELGCACNLLAARVTSLWRLVAQFDQDLSDGQLRSFGELGLRAQTLAALFLLDELYEEIRNDPARYQDLFIGRFRSIDDVVSFIFDSLAQLSHIWVRQAAQRSLVLTPVVDIACTPTVVYYAAIRNAQQSIAMLDCNADLHHFLTRGELRADAPRVASACAQLRAVLHTTLSRELDPSLFLAAALFAPPQRHNVENKYG